MPEDRPTGPSDLGERIARAQARHGHVAGGTHVNAKGYKQGSRVLAELIGAPIGGALIGWLLDQWLSTGPWLMLILLTLSIVVAFRNIFRISKEKVE